MAKLLKTISLEDRLKNSIYNEIASTMKMPNQGEIDLKQQERVADPQSIQLKQLPDPVIKNSNILKGILSSKQSKAIPTLGITKIMSLADALIPFVNTKFRSAISLSNRLKQTDLGSTTHLSQFFLSDIHTDFIKIKPFGVFNHTSTVEIRPLDGIVYQGGENPVIPSFNVNSAQGLLFSNGNYTSITQINIPAYDSLLLQGTVYSNSVYQSRVNITNSVPLNSIVQDANIFITPAIGTDRLTQDANINIPLVPPSVIYLQGVLLDSSNNQTSVSVIDSPKNVVKLVPSSIIIVTPNKTHEQGGVNPIPITFDPKINTPTLKVLAYEADRLLALALPKIKHGKSGIANSITKQDSTYFQDSGITFIKLYTAFQQSQRNVLVLGEKSDLKDLNAVYSKLVLSTQAATFSKQEDGAYTNTKYVAFDGIPHSLSDTNADYAKALRSKDGEGILNQLSINNPSNDIDPIRLNSTDLANNECSKTSLSDYSTLTYDEIVARSKDTSDQREDFRLNLQKKLRDGKGNIIKIIPSKSVNYRGVDNNATDDFVKLEIKSLTGQGSVQFRAFITNFTDGFTTTWTDINYVGRQDTLKAFKGVTRGGSIGFKVAAFNAADLQLNYEKLNQLAKIVAIGSGKTGETYITGPVSSITVGRWFKDTPVVFNTLKFDIQLADYAWDIDKQMPQLVDVSMDFAVIGDIKGDPYNASTNNYFNIVT